MRKLYLDNIRWSTVVLVVLYHVFFMYNGVGIPTVLGKITTLEVQYYDCFQYIVYPWFMMILFLVSGICSRLYLEKHTAREFLRSRTRKLLVPSTVGLFAFQFIQGWVNMSIVDAFDGLQDVPAAVRFLIMLLSGTGVLWYIQLLWVFSVMLLLIRKIERNRLQGIGGRINTVWLILLAVPVWAAAQILNTPIICVYRFGLYGLVFLLGYFVFWQDAVIELLKKRFALFLGIAAVLGTAFCIVYFGENYADKPVNRTPLFTCYGWFACLAVLGGAAKYADFENRFTRFMNRQNFGLYVFHYLGISAVALFFGKSGMLPAPAVYLLSIVAGFAVPYLLNAVISRIPVYRWCVLGIRKEKSDVQ